MVVIGPTVVVIGTTVVVIGLTVVVIGTTVVVIDRTVALCYRDGHQKVHFSANRPNIWFVVIGRLFH